MRTFNTAVIYYHKFRLVHKDTEYQLQHGAAAALFSACKIEDTLKKSKEIICASWNLKLSASEHMTPDDPQFDSASKTVIGCERLMLEASGFDYRNRHPQKYLIKLARKNGIDKDITKSAYRMLLDLYRTFAPLKQSCAAMAFGCLELTCRLYDRQMDKVVGEGAQQPSRWKTTRAQVMEVMLDLLDLYTHFQKSTLLGPSYHIDTFIKIRIGLNQEASEKSIPRFAESKELKQNGLKHIKTPKTPITPTSPTDIRVNGNRDIASPATLSPRSSGSGRKGGGVRGQDGTVRFMLDGEQAKEEKKVVAEYFDIEYEEYEVEVDEPVPIRAEPMRPDHRPRFQGHDRRDDRRGGHGAYGGRPFKRPRQR